jgi:hypothetical protein
VKKLDKALPTTARGSYVKQLKLLTTFYMADLWVIFEYKVPVQRLVGKVGNNFLSAEGFGQKKLF